MGPNFYILEICRERIYSFFMHVRGLHEWEEKKFADLIPIVQGTKIGPKFQKELKFREIHECAHDLHNFEGRHAPVDPSRPPFQKLLEIAAKTHFINDIDHLKHGNITSFVESFHSVCIRYRPKRKYYPSKGFEIRTMLAALAFNENRLAELVGKRTVQQVYECYSKVTGERRQKIKKGPSEEGWKAKIVNDTLDRQQDVGVGQPLTNEDLVDDMDLLADWLGDILNFESDEDNSDE